MPNYLLEDSKLEFLDISPKPHTSHHFCFEQTVDGLCERIVVRVADASHGTLNTGFDQTFTGMYRQIEPPRDSRRVF